MQQQNTSRAFTKADVEAFFQQGWGKSEKPVNELESIHLLAELCPPTWGIRYTSIWEQGTRYEHISYHTMVVVQKTREDGQLYLNLPGETELPEGCATVTEEDAEIERIEQAKLAKWRKQWGQDHAI